MKTNIIKNVKKKILVISKSPNLSPLLINSSPLGTMKYNHLPDAWIADTPYWDQRKPQCHILSWNIVEEHIFWCQVSFCLNCRPKGLSQLMRSSAAIGSFLVKVDYVPRFGNAIRYLENFWTGRSAKEFFLFTGELNRRKCLIINNAFLFILVRSTVLFRGRLHRYPVFEICSRTFVSRNNLSKE